MKYTNRKQINETTEIIVNIRLNDECKNGHDDFSITAEIKENHRFVSAGCLHDDVVEHFPEFKTFVKLHLADSDGVPMYAIENGLYWLKENLQKGADYLRVDITTAKKLMDYVGDKNAFGYALVKMGIKQARQEESKKAIEQLEKLTGAKFTQKGIREFKYIEFISLEHAKAFAEN